MRRLGVTTVALAVTSLAVVPVGHADRDLKIGVYSQNISGQRAAVGATIRVHSSAPGRVATARSTAGPSRSRDVMLPPYPSIATTSPLLRNPAPLGPGSFWYTDQAGHSCLYQPESALPCFQVVTPGSGSVVRPGIDPAGVAAAIAAGLTLSPGEIRMSPASGGLTGAASWFWLDTAPTTSSVSVTLAGESVTVTAVPEVAWQFGDGGTAQGTGVSYRPGSPPSAAVTHVYDVRCLPHDRGRNPYVLPGCGERGYAVEAVVTWRVTYRASGLLAASGGLAPRTTTTSVVYPVSEARAFLVPTDAQ
jgi:hypothetical protein